MGQGVHSPGPDTKTEDDTESINPRIEREGTERREKPDDILWKNSNQKAERNTPRDIRLKCLYTNADSIIGKLDELKQKLEENDYDVIGIVESWANATINDAE